MADLDQLTQKASTNLDRLNANLDSIRSNPRLSADGQKELVAQAYIKALDRSREPPRPLGATASHKIAVDSSYRDALQRAHQTNPATNELAELYDLARRVDDDLLARAALVAAIDRPDHQLLQSLHTTDAATGQKVSRLFELRSGANDLKFSLHLQMTVPDPTQPPELGGLGEVQIRNLARVIVKWDDGNKPSFATPPAAQNWPPGANANAPPINPPHGQDAPTRASQQPCAARSSAEPVATANDAANHQTSSKRTTYFPPPKVEPTTSTTARPSAPGATTPRHNKKSLLVDGRSDNTHEHHHTPSSASPRPEGVGAPGPRRPPVGVDRLSASPRGWSETDPVLRGS